MRVRLYFDKEVIWYYQVINGEVGTNNLIYGLDRKHEEKMAVYKRSLQFGLAQRPDVKDVTFTKDMRRRIINPIEILTKPVIK